MSIEFDFTKKDVVLKQISDNPDAIIEYFNTNSSKLSYSDYEILSNVLQEVKDTIRDLTYFENEILEYCVLKIKMLDDKDNFWNNFFHNYVDRCAYGGMDINDPKDWNEIITTFVYMSKFIVPSEN